MESETTHASHNQVHAGAAGGAAFYVLPETRRKLANETITKVVLAGSFTGGWNFGDLMQLQGALRWQRLHQLGHALCVIHGLGSAPDRAYFDRLERVFGACDWLFFSPGRAAHTERAAALGLERLCDGISGPVTLHVYGGGFFNRLWGEGALRRIETLFDDTTPLRYIISGQQIGAEFAAALAGHCRRYQPDLIGCRDDASVELMRRHGLHAEFSGDDAFEELASAASPSPSQGEGRDEGKLPAISPSPRRIPGAPDRPAAAPSPSQGEGRDEGVQSPSFGLYLNSSTYVTTAAQSTALRAIERDLRLLARHTGGQGAPLLITAYAEGSPDVFDTRATLARTGLATLFPMTERLDLVDAIEHRGLERAARELRQCRLVVSMSYHVTLFCKIVGVPVHLLVFNEYYRQKRQSLGDAPATLAEFLAADVRQVMASQAAFVAQLRERRARWLELAGAALSAAPAAGRVQARAAAALDRRQAPSGGGGLHSVARRLRDALQGKRKQ